MTKISVFLTLYIVLTFVPTTVLATTSYASIVSGSDIYRDGTALILSDERRIIL